MRRMRSMGLWIPTRARRVVFFALVGALAAAFFAPVTLSSAEPAPDKLNIVVILADDLGWADLGCYGSTFYETPALDKLATQGMRFTYAYAAAHICSPSRAALMSGKWPARLHTTNFFGGNRRGKLLPPEYRQSLPTEETTIAESFGKNGYRTAISGKWHLGGKGSQPADHGFEVVIGAHCGPGKGPADDTHFATFLSTEAVKFIEESKEKPFFLYLPLHSVHIPLKTRPELLKKYTAKAEKLGASIGPSEGLEHEHKLRFVQDHPIYAGMMQEMDEAVARVLTKLDELKLTDRTVVLFTSDNGGLSTAEGWPTSNLPLRAGKGWNYEGGLRVPFIMRLPGRIAAGSLCETPVITCDIYPTLMELAGLTMPAEQKVDGVSIATLLEGKGQLAERTLFWHYPHYSNQGGRPSGAIRTGTTKLVEFFEDSNVELYDVVKDVGEKSDLAPAQKERAEAMRKTLDDWRKAVDAQMPTPNPEPIEPFGPQSVPKKK